MDGRWTPGGSYPPLQLSDLPDPVAQMHLQPIDFLGRQQRRASRTSRRHLLRETDPRQTFVRHFPARRVFDMPAASATTRHVLLLAPGRRDPDRGAPRPSPPYRVGRLTLLGHGPHALLAIR